jgi:MSHA biogenesis protein MshJ
MISSAFIALSSREKWLIGFAGLISIVLLFFTLQLEPIWDAQHKTRQAMTRFLTSNASMRGDIEALKVQLSQHPDGELDKQLAIASQQQQVLSQQLGQFVGGFVAPTDMVARLTSVLTPDMDLALQHLTSLPVEPVGIDSRQLASHRFVSDDKARSVYYIHPLRIELVGEQAAMQRYLQQLEALDEPYFWRSLHYEVLKNGQVKMMVQVYTLGLEPSFIASEGINTSQVEQRK